MGLLKSRFPLYQTIDWLLANPRSRPSMTIHIVVDPRDPLLPEDPNRCSNNTFPSWALSKTLPFQLKMDKYRSPDRRASIWATPRQYLYPSSDTYELRARGDAGD